MPKELNVTNYARQDKRTKSRKCLHCGRFFRSYHAGHRICPRCANLDEFQHKRAGIPEHGIVE